MIPMLEQIAQNPEQVTFTGLFVGLLIYVIRTNDAREKNYRDTIEKLTDSLSGFEALKEKVESIWQNTPQK